ncbi:hypothetical protein D3C76_1472320 [compost metagenome]
MSLGRQHQRLSKQAAAAHHFITLYLGLAAVILVNSRQHKLLHRLRRFTPDVFHLRFPAGQIATQHNQHRGIGYLRLAPSHFADMFTLGTIFNQQRAPMLQVESTRGVLQGNIE